MNIGEIQKLLNNEETYKYEKEYYRKTDMEKLLVESELKCKKYLKQYLVEQLRIGRDLHKIHDEINQFIYLIASQNVRKIGRCRDS